MDNIFINSSSHIITTTNNANAYANIATSMNNDTTIARVKITNQNNAVLSITNDSLLQINYFIIN